MQMHEQHTYARTSKKAPSKIQRFTVTVTSQSQRFVDRFRRHRRQLEIYCSLQLVLAFRAVSCFITAVTVNGTQAQRCSHENLYDIYI
jgi:hypothetical protein